MERKETYYLKLNGDHSEVQDLDSGPQDKVGLESRDVHILELANQRLSPAPFSNSHESEEANKTWSFVSKARWPEETKKRMTDQTGRTSADQLRLSSELEPSPTSS